MIQNAENSHSSAFPVALFDLGPPREKPRRRLADRPPLQEPPPKPPPEPLPLRVRTFGLDPKYHTNYAGARAILGQRGNILKRRSTVQLVRAAIGTAFPILLAAEESAIDDVRAAVLQSQLIIVELARRLGLSPIVDYKTDDPLANVVHTDDQGTPPDMPIARIK